MTIRPNRPGSNFSGVRGIRALSLQYRPLTIVVAFNLFTLLVFLLAPFQWAAANIPLVVLLIVSSLAMLALGYNMGFRKSAQINPQGQMFHRISTGGMSMFLFISSITLPLKYAYLTRYNVMDVAGMFNHLMIGVRDPQMGYALSLEPTNAPTVRWSVYFIISIINQPFFIVGFLGWKGFNLLKKCVFLTFLGVEVFYWMGIGTNIGIIVLVTTFVFSQLHRIKATSISYGQLVKYGTVVMILFVISVGVFSYNLRGRSGFAEINVENFDMGAARVERQDKVVSMMPVPLQSTYMYFTSYISQGYYHTALAFDLDFKWTYLVGNNPAALSLTEEMGARLWERTYMFRLWSKGVDPLINWHSAYTWFADDVTYFGVPFLMFFFGFVLGCSWGLGSRYDDFLSKLIFVITANMLLFLFANNSYLSSVFYSCIAIVPFWIFTRLVNASRGHDNRRHPPARMVRLRTNLRAT